MRITAKVDYATRAMIVLAGVAAEGGGPTKGERIATAQQVPPKYLENILGELRQAGIIRSQRGADGGYWLARPASEVTVADVIRAVEGPLADVRGEAPEDLEYPEGTGSLQEVWIATRAALRSVLDQVTLADIVAGTLPGDLAELLATPDAWARPWRAR